MIDFKFYFYILYFFILIIAFNRAIQIDFRSYQGTLKYPYYIIFILITPFLYLFGSRNYEIGVDTKIYLLQFESFEDIDFGTDIIMFYIIKALHFFGLSFQSFLYLFSLLFLGVLTIGIYKNSKIFKSNPVLILFCFVSLFFFQTLGVNVIRQGVSLSFLILFITNYEMTKGNLKSWLIPCVLCVFFHLTSFIPIFFYFLICYFKDVKIKVFYWLYWLCLILAMAGISILSFKDYLGFLLVDERRASSYLTSTDKFYNIGFKPQFVVFNTLFLVLFIFIRKNIEVNSYYDKLLKYYLTTSCIFYLTFQMPYSDRWGLMSWIVIPILISPVFNVNFTKKIATQTVFMFLLIFLFFENY